MAVSGALLLHWLDRLTFWRDEWDFLLHRARLEPGHLPRTPSSSSCSRSRS